MNPMRHMAWMMAVLAFGWRRACRGRRQAAREPHIGYVFPAGAKSGSTVEVLVGGQILRDASQVVVSGSGVSARVLKVYRAGAQLRQGTARGNPTPHRRPPRGARRPPGAARSTPRPKDAPALVMPEHVLLDRLERADAAELEHLVQVFLRANRMQTNAQLGEMVTLEVTVDPAAVPGVRELRLLTAAGLTNPAALRDRHLRRGLRTRTERPETRAGRRRRKWPHCRWCSTGRCCRATWTACGFTRAAGRSLVVEVQARSLIPYLADAVPGWFQPVAGGVGSAGQGTGVWR